MPRDKISKFVEAINQEADKKRAMIEQETEAFIKQEIEKAENEALEESYALIQQKTVSIKEDIGREFSNRELLSRKQLFIRREEITNKVFEEARERIKAFTGSGDYLPLLKKSVQKAVDLLKNQKIVLFIRPTDMPFAEELQKISPNIEIRQDDTIEIGGIKVHNAAGTILLEDTLDSRLEAKREWFEENSGLTIA